MTVQYSYVFGEAVADWTDQSKSAQFRYLYAEAMGALSTDAPNVTTSKLFVEVIHDVVALTPAATRPILIACT